MELARNYEESFPARQRAVIRPREERVADRVEGRCFDEDVPLVDSCVDKLRGRRRRLEDHRTSGVEQLGAVRRARRQAEYFWFRRGRAPDRRGGLAARRDERQLLARRERYAAAQYQNRIKLLRLGGIDAGDDGAFGGGVNRSCSSLRSSSTAALTVLSTMCWREAAIDSAMLVWCWT